MHLIDKKDDIPRPLDLRQHIPQTLFEFAPVFRPRDHPGHVDADEPFPPQWLRHMAQGHPLGQPLHDGRLAHAGLTDQRRVVLVLPAKNLDDLGDLRLPADDRLHLLRLFQQVYAKLI